MAMEGINLYSIDYYKMTVFKGSYRGLCFRIGKAEVEATDRELSDSDESGEGTVQGGEAEQITVLRVTAWKGPYILEKTEEEVFIQDFSYSDEGLKQANEWLESKQKEMEK